MKPDLKNEVLPYFFTPTNWFSEKYSKQKSLKVHCLTKKHIHFMSIVSVNTYYMSLRDGGQILQKKNKAYIIIRFSISTNKQVWFMYLRDGSEKYLLKHA